MTLVSEASRTRRFAGAPRLLSSPSWTALALDVAIIVTSLLWAARLRRSGFLLDHAATVSDLTPLAIVIAMGWTGLVALVGGYDRDVFGAGVEEFKRLVAATAMTAAALGIGCFLAHYDLSRGFFLFTFVVGLPSLLVGRYALRKALQRARRDGHFRSQVLLVGTIGSTDEIARVLERETWLGYEVLGALTPAAQIGSETPHGTPVLGNLDDATEVAQQLGADVVFVTGGGSTSSAHMQSTMWALENADVHVVVVPEMTDIARERLKIRPVGGLPLIHVGKPRAARALSWAKRSFDLVCASIMLVTVSPLLLVAAVRVKAHDRGPVLFRQERIGRDGHRFSCLKLRTMVADAESQLAQLHRTQNHVQGLFKMVDDPRVTRPGRLLRRYSIDELPQLWNVVRGDMSLVGPRPPLPSEALTYDKVASRRLTVRPGITGLWQVSGRSNLSWSETIRLDIYYVDNWPMLQDVSILLKTVRAVLRPSGAY